MNESRERVRAAVLRNERAAHQRMRPPKPTTQRGRAKMLVYVQGFTSDFRAFLCQRQRRGTPYGDIFTVYPRMYPRGSPLRADINQYRSFPAVSVGEYIDAEYGEADTGDEIIPGWYTSAHFNASC